MSFKFLCGFIKMPELIHTNLKRIPVCTYIIAHLHSFRNNKSRLKAEGPAAVKIGMKNGIYHVYRH